MTIDRDEPLWIEVNFSKEEVATVRGSQKKQENGKNVGEKLLSYLSLLSKIDLRYQTTNLS